MTLLIYNLLTVIINHEDLVREGYTIHSKAEEGVDVEDEFALENLGSKLVRMRG